MAIVTKVNSKIAYARGAVPIISLAAVNTKGNFENNYFHGQGTYTFADGREYSGDFFLDHIKGRGTLTYPDGEKYTGNFVNGRYHGHGILSFAMDRVPLEGLWNDGRFVRYEKTNWHY
jgi:hypothetical protein